MAYQSLYRRYRPRRFSDVRGQGHIISALRNAVRDDRVGHAYLFSGPRGTGKTSTARILAKALNCEHLIEGEPDGTCESCLAIDFGRSFDVQELDAASNNGVDEIRDLIRRVALGSPGRTKVYILDEVHMLSPAASAALLKTLEEPPAHVVFVLATTDPQKVLPTIRSRTQHFDFHLLSVEELSEHVAWVIHDAKLGLDADVIEHVVRAGAGSARDTLSALDQVAAAGGVFDKGQALDDLLDALAASDTGKALLAVADAIASGRDPRILAEAVLARLRDIFLLRMGGSTDHLPPGDIDRVQAWADQLGDRATTRALEVVGDALLEMRQARDPRIPLEIALVKITRVEAGSSVEGLSARVAKLEAALASGSFSVAAPASRASASTSGGSPSARSAPVRPAPARPASARSASAGSGLSDSPAPNPSAPSAPATNADSEVGSTQGTSRSAPPPRPGGRPADTARAQLAANRSGRATPPPRPGSSPAATPAATSAATVPSAPAVADAPVEPPPVSEPSIAGQPASEGTAPVSDAVVSAPEAASPAAADPPSSGLDKDGLTALLNDTVLPALGGMTRAMYAVGHFVEFTGTTATLAFPNEVHRQQCEQKRAEVERALCDGIGSPLKLRLVVDEAAGGTGAGNADRRRGAVGVASTRPPAEPEEDFDLGSDNVHDLDDAPDAPAGGLDALTDAFPGSELVEGT